jgi:hypothetical protein
MAAIPATLVNQELARIGTLAATAMPHSCRAGAPLDAWNSPGYVGARLMVDHGVSGLLVVDERARCHGLLILD